MAVPIGAEAEAGSAGEARRPGARHRPPPARPAPRDRAGRRGRTPRPPQAQARRRRPPSRTRPTRCSRKLAYVIVNEAGASVYSTSPVGREEFPDFDATLRGTDLDRPAGSRIRSPSWSRSSRRTSASACISTTSTPSSSRSRSRAVIASLRQLRRRRPEHGERPAAAARLGPEPAHRAADRRASQGEGAVHATASSCTRSRGSARRPSRRRPASSRSPAASNPLDRTWVHPESYPVATRLLEKLGFTPEVVRDRERLAGAAREARRGRPAGPGPRAGGRRADPARHLRGPRPARSRPPRRPAQADLQEGRAQARGPPAPAWS